MPRPCMGCIGDVVGGDSVCGDMNDMDDGWVWPRGCGDNDML